MRTRKPITILNYHRNSTVYMDGRYLGVDMKLSARSKRSREIARETAAYILSVVGANEAAHDVMQNPPPAPAGLEDGQSGLRTVQDAPKPPDSFSEEEGKEAVRRVTDE